MRFGKNMLVGLVLDAFDWMVIGMIPVLGDVVDIAATAYWTKELGPVGLAEVVEIIPGADILPVNVVLGMIVDGRDGAAAQRSRPA